MEPPAIQNLTENISEELKPIYWTILRMFPNKDRNYLRGLLINPPIAINLNDINGVVANLTDYILENFDQGNTDFPENELFLLTEDFDQRWKNLQSIFPDADPNFLKEISKGDAHSIDDFIENGLNYHSYAKKMDSKKEENSSTVEKKHQETFDVEEFMQGFIDQDPVAFFENDERKNVKREQALQYLLNTFEHVEEEEIEDIYKENRFNLSISYKALMDKNPDVLIHGSLSVGQALLEIDDVALIQEITYLKNKEAIEEYMLKMKQEEEKEISEAKASGSFLKCELCFIENLIPSKTVTCSDGHIFCKGCVKEGVEVSIATGNFKILCFIDGQNEFTADAIKKVLQPRSFEIFMLKRQEKEIMDAKIEGFEICPFCSVYGYVPPEGDKIFKCEKCLKESCRACKSENHLPKKCTKGLKEDDARKMIEESMSNALIRNCPSCKKPFCKDGTECNHIICACGYQLCYLCQKRATDYSHFRGQGSNRFDLCPLFTDDLKMEAEYVTKVANEVKEKIEHDSNVNVDIQKILPQIPLASEGSHEQVLNNVQDPFQEYAKIRDSVE